MEITAWDIYWVMQLDTIGVAASLISFLGLILIPLAVGASVFEIKRAWAYFTTAGLALVWMLALLTAIFLPSSKTAAAMLIIPAIANSVTIQNEAKDIYALAKQGLSELVKPDQPKPEKKD